MINCTVCSNANVIAIDKAVRAKTSLRSIEVQFAVGRHAVKRHSQRCLNIEPPGPKQLRTHGPIPLPKRIRIDSPSDVVEELLYLYSTAKGLLESAQNIGDRKSSERMIGQTLAVLEKIGSSLGMFKNQGITVNVDATQRRLDLHIGKLTDEELEKLIHSRVPLGQ